GRSRVIIAAANARIDAIDTPSFNFDDPEGLNVESRRVKDMGYVGKIVVHINQIEIVNRAFTPGKDEIEWARMILEARKNTGIGNICVVNGKMVGPPMYNSARRTLEIARRTGLLN
ncbi:MAG TPA: hypothetical protein VK186_08240, partial [Candidatus Deferrimicrobium sp.]|nr:hypothetical protein [Candidatus Deferrimicrobium sp.]